MNTILSKKISWACILLVVLIIISGNVFAEQAPDNLVLINIPARMLELYKDGKLVNRWPVAVGKPSTPTPVGIYQVNTLEVNPSWYPTRGIRKAVPSGPANPLGYRWIGIYDTYGIHGTNQPWTIGGWISNGCIRMLEDNVEQLFKELQVSYPVQIVYERLTLRVDETGRVIMEIFPDIYGRQPLDATIVRQYLSRVGIIWQGSAIPQQLLVFGPYSKLNNKQGFLFGISDGWVWPVYYNMRPVKLTLYFGTGDEPLVDSMELARIMHVKSEVADGDITVNKRSVRVETVNGRYFISLAQVAKLFGINAFWDGKVLRLDDSAEFDNVMFIIDWTVNFPNAFMRAFYDRIFTSGINYPQHFFETNG